MKPRSFIAVTSLTFALAACSAPQIDQSAATFNQSKYTSDLNLCRGGSIVEASARSIGVAMVGSALGAVNGASLGMWNGNGWEGAAIGAAVGGTIGIGVGAFEAIEKHDTEISSCLRDKGYVVTG